MVLGDTEAIKTAVEQGMGVAIMSAWAVQKEMKHGTVRAAKFRDIRFDRDLRIIYHRSNAQTRAATAFLDYVKRYPLEPLVAVSARS
jgi:DNA-binding transcriptional LysR family regulator